MPAALPPASFSFDDPTQGLAARRAAKLLAGAAMAPCEVFFTARTFTVKNGEVAGLDTADFGFAVIGVLWGSDDISDGRVCSAIGEPPRGTQDCNIELGDGWG